MMERRSFLALIAGALAIKPEVLLSVPKGDGGFLTVGPLNTLLPYIFTHQVHVLPASIETPLIIPPNPSAFTIASIGFSLDPEAPYAEINTVFQNIYLEVRKGKRLMLEAALHHFGVGVGIGPCQNWQPWQPIIPEQFRFATDESVEFRLRSDVPLPTSKAVRLDWAFQGYVVVPSETR